MGNVITKECFENILCNNKVKPLNRTASSPKVSTDSNQLTKSEHGTGVPTFGEAIDYDADAMQQPPHRIAWDEPKEFLTQTISTISQKGGDTVQQMVNEEIINPIKETVSSKWKKLNLESAKKVTTGEAPATPWLLHPDACHEIDQQSTSQQL